MSVFSKLCTDIVDFSTHNSNARTEKITKITIHHMACVASGADCARAHYRKNSASANYYIGTNGDICGGVSEDRRAWTSGSSWNDQRAITFEVSNSEAKEPWPVSDAAYRSAIRLAADICKRYGITPHYTGDKNGTLTLHCMYQATACPGTTWKQRHASGKVERDILEAMAITPPTPQPDPVSDEEKIWNYLSARIHNDYGVAGLMGNLYAESTLHSNNLQNTFEKRLGMTDEEYTAAVDDGSYPEDKFIRDGAGYGLAQWTFWSRKENLYARKGNKSIGDLDMQLDFLWWELSTGYKGTLQALQTATSIYGASTAVLTQFERPADQSEAMKQKRASYGQIYFDRYSQSVPFRPYIARITADELNVRKGPGINYGIVQTVRKGEAFTIVQESGEWGKLKSGVGWICLTYTMKVRLV
jgi:hypothetical protein